MRIELFNEERVFNRAKRVSEVRRYSCGAVIVPDGVVDGMRGACSEYNMNLPQMVVLALSYYFGDGQNHLQCEFCDFWRGCCSVPEQGGQTTMPLLDKGMVVVGHPTSDQGV